MRWKVMSKTGNSPGWGVVLDFKRGVRRYRITYLFVVVLFLILIPQISYKVSKESQKIKKVKSVFGDNLLPTPWHWHENVLGPNNQTWERGWAILKCSYPRLYKPSRQKLLVLNATQECPSYFHWIQKDLAPWKLTGITSTNLETAEGHAAFKVVILNGRLYLDLYYSCVQTRAVFTVWGILMLMEKFEGKIPDVEMMFDCMDRPHIEKTNLEPSAEWSPAPLFRYCSNSQYYDLPWPDWSFWGWSETNLYPWEEELSKIKKGAEKTPWRLKVPKAYWRGNPNVGSALRQELMTCKTATKSPQTEIYNQDWTSEIALGKKHSKLEDQCEHRYKIYAEGFAWSVSFKYIMACGSPTMAISPAYYDFFMRGLEPGVHYLPVRPKATCAAELCGALDNAVTTAEKDLDKAFHIGQAGRDFVSNEVGMSSVYDYMYHMIRAYAELQRFKPTRPRRAREVTQDFILCMASPFERLLLEKSREQIPWTPAPCHLKETPSDGFKDFGWETTEDWSQTNCRRSRKGKRKDNKNKAKSKSQLHKVENNESTPLKTETNESLAPKVETNEGTTLMMENNGTTAEQ
ncbi:unnamed protein product [Calypogeia fissa]